MPPRPSRKAGGDRQSDSTSENGATNRPRQDFWQVQMRLVIAGQAETISLCGRCAALVLASDRSQKLHKAFHEQMDNHDER
jgi:hypothetical protein